MLEPVQKNLMDSQWLCLNNNEQYENLLNQLHATHPLIAGVLQELNRLRGTYRPAVLREKHATRLQVRQEDQAEAPVAPHKKATRLTLYFKVSQSLAIHKVKIFI